MIVSRWVRRVSWRALISISKVRAVGTVREGARREASQEGDRLEGRKSDGRIK